MAILEAMRQRRSVRTFNGQPVSGSQKQELIQAAAQAGSPFGGEITIRLKDFDLRGGYRPSTYGMIKGASSFFLIGYGNDPDSALSAGFKFEQVVLKAWQMGLGTCWIAATFKGSDFDRDEVWPAGSDLKIVSPVGVPDRITFKEKIIRFSVGSQKRKPFDDLFFANGFSNPVPAENPFREPLEMLRLAPSSTNSQPWRATVGDSVVHFFYKPKSKLSLVDCGIGLCHFIEAEKFRGHDGAFFKSSDLPVSPAGLNYLISYRRL